MTKVEEFNHIYNERWSAMRLTRNTSDTVILSASAPMNLRWINSLSLIDIIINLL